MYRAKGCEDATSCESYLIAEAGGNYEVRGFRRMPQGFTIAIVTKDVNKLAQKLEQQRQTPP